MSAIASAANDLIGTQLRAGNAVQFSITTRSMLPSLAPGDQIRARGIRANEPRPGDIVMIRSEPHWLAHRLIATCVVNTEIRFVTQGDNCTESDSLWSPEQICGIITNVKRQNREYCLESKRARRRGALIAQLLRRRAGWGSKKFFLRINAAAVRALVWLG